MTARKEDNAVRGMVFALPLALVLWMVLIGIAALGLAVFA